MYIMYVMDSYLRPSWSQRLMLSETLGCNDCVWMVSGTFNEG